MPTLADLVASYTRIPTATVRMGGQLCRAVISLRTSQAFGSGIATGTIVLRDPPVAPAIGTPVSWRWGYNGVEVPGFTGEIARPGRKSYPNRWTIECRDVLWRADRSQQVIATDPLNNITASDAIRYILTHYGGIPASRISIPTFSASGSEWGGSEWTLGTLTPVSWGDIENNTGGTTALKAAQEICSVLGYWLYADASGIIRAKQMERAPSLSPAHTFQRGVDLLTEGSPELVEDVDAIRNRIIVRGANTGVDGAQIRDTFQTSHPLLPAGVFQEDTFSSFLVEYVNASEAGAASATEIAKRILKVRSRLPIVVRHRTKADPRLSVGATVAIQDSGIGYTAAKNFFIYALETSLDCVTGDFSQQHTLDGGTGNSGYSTIPPPDASFSWRLMAETLDGDAVVEVFLDGSGSTSLSGGEIVSWDWSTSTPTYGGSPDTATGEQAMLLFEASNATADITLTVTDTTSKQGSITQTIDLTGADTAPPIQRVLSVAFGSSWAVTPDGGATWNVEATGDAIAVGTIGAGRMTAAQPPPAPMAYWPRAARAAQRCARRSTPWPPPSVNVASAGAAITSNIWINEHNPARVWFAAGSAVYRSTDGGVTKTAMAAAPASVSWIMEDPEVENSVFILAGADMYNATDPTVGWALLYEGPVGATARQFVRSRDGQVTWICYTGAPSGEALQRVENGAAADIAATDIRTLALDNAASSLLATLYAITGDDPAQIWTFDGLTGLSAAQATPTLPAGGTAMHMLADPDVDVQYIASFDSITTGTGAVHKLVGGQQLFLYRAGSSGEQAHMLGFGARVTGPFELILMTFQVDPGGVWYYRDGTWTFRPLPVSGTVRGLQIAADPFNPDRWLAVFNNVSTSVADNGGVLGGSSWAHSPMWLTSDAGVTWEEVLIPTPPGLPGSAVMGGIAWSEQVAGQWAVALGSNNYTCIIRGTVGTVTTTTEDTSFVCTALTSGLEGDFVLAAHIGGGFSGVGELRYIDSSGTIHTPAGSSPGDIDADVFLYRTIDRVPGNSYAVYAAGPGRQYVLHRRLSQRPAHDPTGQRE
jgi:hypothetical protein